MAEPVFKLFSNTCGGCGKAISSFAKNKNGDLPAVFCSRSCETLAGIRKQYGPKQITHAYDAKFSPRS